MIWSKLVPLHSVTSNTCTAAGLPLRRVALVPNERGKLNEDIANGLDLSRAENRRRCHERESD